jgi:hypothetical protein
VVCVVELDPITIHEGDGRVRTEGRDGELFQEIPPDLEIRILLMFRFIRLRPPGSLLLRAATGRSRLVFQLSRLLLGGSSAAAFIRSPLLGNWSGRGGRDRCFLQEPRRRGREGVILLRVSSCSPSVKVIARGRCPLTVHLQPRHARPIDQSAIPRLHFQNLKGLRPGQI